MPWPSILVLAAVTFVIVTGEMLPTAMLPPMAADLAVPAARVGILVSLWAATVVVASFPLVRLTRRWDRRPTITGALGVFGIASLATALAPSFGHALASRLVAAAACGLLWSTINAHTADIVPQHRLARAVAVVLGGGTLGTVLAVPAANAAAQVWDWRGVFVAVAILSLAGAAAVATVVVPGRSPEPGGETDGAGSGRPRAGRVRAVLAVAGLGGLLLAGHFTAYTFVTRLLDESGAPGGVSGLLLIFGVTSAAAVVVVGRVGDWRPAALLAGTAVTLGVALLGLLGAGTHPALDIGIVAVWGLASGAVGPLAQTAILRSAGPSLRSLAGTAIPVAFNLGIALGAAAGSGTVERLGVTALPPLAAGIALAAAAGLAALARPRGD